MKCWCSLMMYLPVGIFQEGKRKNAFVVHSLGQQWRRTLKSLVNLALPARNSRIERWPIECQSLNKCADALSRFVSFFLFFFFFRLARQREHCAYMLTNCHGASRNVQYRVQPASDVPNSARVCLLECISVCVSCVVTPLVLLCVTSCV